MHGNSYSWDEYFRIALTLLALLAIIFLRWERRRYITSESKFFGRLKVPRGEIITFPDGMAGARAAIRFVIRDLSEDGLFRLLQSCDQTEVCFIIAETERVVSNYMVPLLEADRRLISVEEAEDATAYLVLYIPQNPREATVNLLGPIVVNAKARLGTQMVLFESCYRTRHPVFGDGADPSGGANEGKSAVRISLEFQQRLLRFVQ